MFILGILLYFTVHLLSWTEAAPERGYYPSSSHSPLIPIVHLGDKSYYFGFHLPLNHLRAMQFCQLINMNLVSILSAAQERPLFEYLRNNGVRYHMWSSGTRAIDGNTWVWLSAGRAVRYTHWLPNEPSGGDELCIELLPERGDGLFWNDANCKSELFFICEN